MSAGSETVRFAQVRPKGCTCRQPWQVCPACEGTPRAQMVAVVPAQQTTRAQRLLGAVRSHLVAENVRDVETRLDGLAVIRHEDVEAALSRVGEKREGL